MIQLLKTKTAAAWHMLLLFTIAFGAPYAHAQSFEKVAAGAAHICAIDTSGQVECTTSPIATRFLPPNDLPLMQEISAGQQHTCGITFEGSVNCWGSNAYGVLQVPMFDAPVESITSGHNHACAIDSNKQMQCWGLNSNRQLDVPDVAGGFVAVDASRNASCGIDTNGDIHCWSSDTFLNTDEPISGPFVDLDLDTNHACGLTVNGDIECWVSRERSNLTPPTSGPYTDLTVTNSAICGLRVDQLLDCSFAAPTSFDLETMAEDYPTDVRFSSIERSSLSFAGVPICGIRADNGTISCFGGSGFGGDLPAPPGAGEVSASLTAANISLGLTAKIYGTNQVELFWNRLPYVFPPISVEIYRDDELLTTTSNNFSFYDNDSSVITDESRYRVRTVDDAGNVGDFSNTVVVNRVTFDVDLLDGGAIDNPRPDAQLRIQDLSVTAFAHFVSNNDTFILSWNVENVSDTPIAGYEIRIDNEPVAFVTNTSFIGDGVSQYSCRVYSVAAVDSDGAILDYASAAYGRSAIWCPSAR